MRSWKIEPVAMRWYASSILLRRLTGFSKDTSRAFTLNIPVIVMSAGRSNPNSYVLNDELTASEAARVEDSFSNLTLSSAPRSSDGPFSRDQGSSISLADDNSEPGTRTISSWLVQL